MSRSKRKPAHPRIPHEVGAIRRELQKFLDFEDSRGRKPCNAKCGVYVFYDYDGEPIYVGKTQEQLRTRIRRHLTNQRTDAVAMNVLDPFEVAEIEVFPFFDLEKPSSGESGSAYITRVKQTLSAAEYTLFQRVLVTSRFHAVLNEKDIAPAELVELPESHRAVIIPSDIYRLRRHPDVRIARRAMTIANLARVISERGVQLGLRRTLLTQAKRLEWLAETRLADFDPDFPEEHSDEETGEKEAESDE